MRLTHLSLTNFRTFSRLDLDIPGGIVVLAGDNAQGKTSLLEAVYFLAAFTSFQTSQDNQVVSFSARDDEIPVSRIVGEYEKGGKTSTLELRLILQNTASSRWNFGPKAAQRDIVEWGKKTGCPGYP